LTVDYAGSSPATRRAVNVVLNYTKAYTTYGVKCVVAPHVPNNAGSFRPVTITAPEGSLLNAVRPAPVASRHLIGLFLPDAVMTALSKAVPDRVIAESSSILWTLDVRGRDRTGHTFKEFMATGGGMGARPTKDGLNATQFPSTIRGVPAEIVESTSPLVIHRRALAPDSGGAAPRRRRHASRAGQRRRRPLARRPRHDRGVRRGDGRGLAVHGVVRARAHSLPGTP